MVVLSTPLQFLRKPRQADQNPVETVVEAWRTLLERIPGANVLHASATASGVPAAGR